jgi:sigma-B regulation protein RsbU (phosphoserine phosphatase)
MRREDSLGRLARLVREYTAGVSGREVRRLFDHDAARAYSVLTRERPPAEEPAGRARRFLFRVRLAFLGISDKLTPPRRLLFAASIVALVFGLVGVGNVRYRGERTTVSVEFSPLWFLLSSGGLAYLLALELVDRIQVRDELEVARELQAELLPRQVPDLPGYRFAHSYRTANAVGGDYYDITRLEDGRVALMVADASGHGMAAGLVMAIANATLKTALDLDPEPSRVLALLNRTLCRTGGSRTFMSVFYALLTPATGHLETVCAGHPFPLLRRADGRMVEIGRGCLPLGLRDPLEVPTQTFELAPGELLVLYTDGLPEAIDARAEAFGFERIAVLLAQPGSPQEIHDRILRSFDDHVGEEPLRDDLTLMVVGRMGDASPWR